MGRGGSNPWYRKKFSVAASSCLTVVIILSWLVVSIESLATTKKPVQGSTPLKNPPLPVIPITCPSRDPFYALANLPNTTIRPATILYSFAIHHKFDHFQALMELIWAPQNFYVIHVDVKSSDEFYETVVAYAAKFPNVIMSLERYDVIYYGWSVLWTHLHNFKLAIQLNQTRDYFINMAGADIPIKTQREITHFLGEHMGRSFIFEHCTWPQYRQWWRTYTWAEAIGKVIQVSNSPRPEPPGFKLRWGQHYVMLHRDVVEWMFHEPRVWQFLGYLQNVKSPDEMFYATVLYNSPWNGTDRVFTHNNFKYASWDKCCSGSKLTAGHPCVLGICDLNHLVNQNHIFATKIDSDIDAKFVPTLTLVLEQRIEEEIRTGRVKRIPLFVDMKLEPDYIEWSAE